jgi:hypothetical protein
VFPLTALSLALLIPALPDQELSLFSPEDLLASTICGPPGASEPRRGVPL